MLIKSADDKSRRLALFKSLQESPLINKKQRDWLNDQIFRLKKGMDGERDAAFYIDMHFADSENYAVIHDLRLQVDGEAAQIDHLIITRALVFYLLETKSFGGGLSINEFGEFTVLYKGYPPRGIESPIEQSRRHEQVLRKLLQTLDIGGRAGTALEFQHVVLIHPRGTIQRPDPKRFDTSNIIKADQFKSWHEKFVESRPVLKTFGLALNVRGIQTMREIAEKIARQHRPTDLLELPDFMRPRHPPINSAAPKSAAANATPAPASAAVRRVEKNQPQTEEETANEQRKRLVCATCGVKISYEEGKFCWNNPKRFGGLQYCRLHQKDFPR
jgi:hypothetical protein